MLIDQTVELQFAHGGEDGSDMAVRARADNLEGLRQRDGAGYRSSALQDGT